MSKYAILTDADGKELLGTDGLFRIECGHVMTGASTSVTPASPR